MKADPIESKSSYQAIFLQDLLSKSKHEIKIKLSNLMDKNEGIKQIE